MKTNTIHIVFAGGGTGGHLFPGLAVAERLIAQIPRIRITFCGIGKQFERKAVSNLGLEYLVLPARPAPRSPGEAISFFIENLASNLTAQRFLRTEKVSVVVGLGGYTSVPMARAAIKQGVPLILLEQNVFPGKATRWLARRAALVCTSFEETAEYLRCRCPIRVTGNPVRYSFLGLDAASSTKSTLKASESYNDCNQRRRDTLLVLGGSGGAHALNENVPRALHKIRSQLANWRIVHQSGEADYEATRQLYEKFDLPAVVRPFISDMPKILARTGLAVCRAGGTTLAELAVAGVPAILLPFPNATNDHQLINARYFAASGGCVTIDQREVQGRLDDELAEKLCFLLANDELRWQMSFAIDSLSRPNAAQDVADLVWSIDSSQAITSLSAVA